VGGGGFVGGAGGGGGGAPLLETLKVMYRKAQETGLSLHRGPVGQPGVGSFTRDFERPAA